MDEQEKEQTPDAPAETAEASGVLAEPQPGADETTGESYSDAERSEELPANHEAAASAEPADDDVRVDEALVVNAEAGLDGAPADAVLSHSEEQPETAVIAETTGNEDASLTTVAADGDAPVENAEAGLDAAPAAPEYESESPESESFTADQLLMGMEQPAQVDESQEAELLAILEAIVYITDEPLSAKQIADALQKPLDFVRRLLDRLVEEFNKPHHGLSVKEVAGGYKITTKPEHHEAVRSFVKNLNPPLKLSLAALETLAVIAYKQPITAPEIMEIRGVQGAGVLKTLLDRKLITSAGRKNVVGKPILYKTTKEFLVQFGLRDLNELPSLKEFEDLRRFAFSEADEAPLGSDAEATSKPGKGESPETAAESEPAEASTHE